MTEQSPQQNLHNRTYQKALQEELKELASVVGPAGLVDLLLERAFQLHVTDIHLDPDVSGLRIRLRVDGILHDVALLKSDISGQVISRVKLMAGMDITERRFSQDGHISNTSMANQRDIRVGSGPTIRGERLVLRLMPDHTSLQNLEDLGLEDQELKTILDCLTSPYGMVLSVGPVGCGKSTTTYSCLTKLNEPEKSLITIEDPVERRIKGVNQIQIDPKIDYTFVEALRGLLRQDPDVMMVGEIRDPETAHIACRAGMTGILVLSTLHANDTIGTIDVFREFGIPSMFIVDSLQGIISQRLVRKVCSNCRTAYKPDELSAELLGLSGDEAKNDLVKGEGCDRCFQTGHQGRTGVFEVARIRGDVRDAILQERPTNEVHEIARQSGMTTLVESTRSKVLAGITSMDEFHRMLSYASMR